MLGMIKEAARGFLYGRPNRLVRQSDAAVRSSWIEVEPAQTRAAPTPRIFGENFEFPIDQAIPALGVFSFENGRSTAYRGWTYNKDGLLVAETSWFGTSRMHEFKLPASFKKPMELKGTCLSLLSEYAIGNYGHFILDGLSRLGLAERAGWSAASIDHFYVYQPPSPDARLLMRKLGIEDRKCIYANEVLAVKAEKMLVATFPGTGENYAQIVPETLSKPWEAIQSKGRRLFIPRRGRRRLTNDETIEAIAREFDFEIFDAPETTEDSFKAFREASHVVGPHGAGLSNLAWCHAGTKVLELTPSDHILPYFCTLAQVSGLDFSAILGRSEGHRPRGATGPSPYDFRVDPDTFRAALLTITAD